LVLAGAAQAQTGEDRFAANCAACHQSDGKGIEGAFPALAGNVFIKGDPTPAINVVLHGRGGMPTFETDLDDDAIADALTYVRSAWGNKETPVTATQVNAVRKGPKPDPNRPLQAH
jgi:mono/diheme cytochrome c family protein